MNWRPDLGHLNLPRPGHLGMAPERSTQPDLYLLLEMLARPPYLYLLLEKPGHLKGAREEKEEKIGVAQTNPLYPQESEKKHESQVQKLAELRVLQTGAVNGEANEYHTVAGPGLCAMKMKMCLQHLGGCSDIQQPALL